jgi:hypothetical protein
VGRQCDHFGELKFDFAKYMPKVIVSNMRMHVKTKLLG